MSDSRFHGLAQKYLADMVSVQDSLQKLHYFFSAGKDVQCYNCDSVISTLDSYIKTIQSFNSLLREVSDSPVSLTMKYYTLVLIVDQIDHHAYQIRSMIDAYRPYCQLYSRQVLKQKHEIQHSLKKFVQRTGALLQQVSHLLNENRVPEKKPVVVYQYHESGSDIIQQEKGIVILLCRHLTLPCTSGYAQ